VRGAQLVEELAGIDQARETTLRQDPDFAAPPIDDPLLAFSNTTGAMSTDGIPSTRY